MYIAEQKTGIFSITYNWWEKTAKVSYSESKKPINTKLEKFTGQETYIKKSDTTKQFA